VARLDSRNSSTRGGRNWLVCFVYVLKSLSAEKFYTGHTDDLERRLLEHNSGHGYYTKRFMPWIMAYREDVDSKDEAIKREKYLKSAAGRRWVKKKVSA